MRQMLRRAAAGVLLVALASAATPAAADGTAGDPIALHGGPVRLWSHTFAFIPFWSYANGAPFALTRMALRWSAGSAMEAEAPPPVTVAEEPAPAAAQRQPEPQPTARAPAEPAPAEPPAPPSQPLKAPSEEIACDIKCWHKKHGQNPQPPRQPPPAPQPPVIPQPEPKQPAPLEPPEQPGSEEMVEKAEWLTEQEQLMLSLVNVERAKEGLPALQADPDLTKVARLKSQDMIEQNYFSHQSPTYGSPFEMMQKFGISYRTAGENIAGNQSVERAHVALMNSAGHRANILSPNFTHIGIGIVQGGTYGMMFTQIFTGQ